MNAKLATLLTVSVCLVGYLVMTAWADEREFDDIGRDWAARMIREAKERGVEVNADQARELTKRVTELGPMLRELKIQNEQLVHEIREREERGTHEERERNGGGHEQIEHIRQAAEHLHAAGMHEQAEDLMREAERRRRELERDREGHHDEGLHRHLEELAKHVHEIHERLERMERAIVELSDPDNP